MNTSKPVLKKELSNKDLSYLKAKIAKHFKNNCRFDRFNKIVGCPNYSYSAIDATLGLAYTSSSSFAMLSICNTEVYLDHANKYTYNCFGMDMGGFPVVLCQDAEENELYVYL